MLTTATRTNEDTVSVQAVGSAIILTLRKFEGDWHVHAGFNTKSGEVIAVPSCFCPTREALDAADQALVFGYAVTYSA